MFDLQKGVKWISNKNSQHWITSELVIERAAEYGAERAAEYGDIKVYEFFNPLQPGFFYTLLKTSENLNVFWCFQGV